jgi:hypothetical protein
MGERARHQSLTKTRAAGGARPPKSLLLPNSGGGVGWGGVEMERQRSHSSQSPAAALNEAGAPRWARRLLSPLPSSSAPTPLRPTRQRQDSSFLSRLHLAATTYVLGRRVDRAWPTRESGRVQRWAMRPNNGTWSRLLAAQLRTIEKEGAQV